MSSLCRPSKNLFIDGLTLSPFHFLFHHFLYFLSSFFSLIFPPRFEPDADGFLRDKNVPLASVKKQQGRAIHK